MRDLQKIAKECMNELDIIGIEYGNITSFEVNTRAKKRWGQCKMVGGKYSINISIRLLNENVPLESLKDTIIHEILHTCKGCMNHGEKWKRHADCVNRKYGYNIKRCSSCEEKGVERVATVKDVKHKFICEKCGQVICRTRESKFTKYYTFYSCGRCGGDFKKIF